MPDSPYDIAWKKARLYDIAWPGKKTCHIRGIYMYIPNQVYTQYILGLTLNIPYTSVHDSIYQVYGSI
jgi:hypothetical protein